MGKREREREGRVWALGRNMVVVMWGRERERGRGKRVGESKSVKSTCFE